MFVATMNENQLNVKLEFYVYSTSFREKLTYGLLYFVTYGKEKSVMTKGPALAISAASIDMNVIHRVTT